MDYLLGRSSRQGLVMRDEGRKGELSRTASAWILPTPYLKYVFQTKPRQQRNNPRAVSKTVVAMPFWTLRRSRCSVFFFFFFWTLSFPDSVQVPSGTFPITIRASLIPRLIDSEVHRYTRRQYPYYPPAPWQLC